MKNNLIKRLFFLLKETYLRLSSDLHNERPIFIVGCGHSGTTILLRILANHNDLYGVNYESKALQGNYPKISQILEWKKNTRQSGKLRWVEKTPKHIQYIDRIFKIFPLAKVIVMQRDGRDVTVSMRKRFGDSKLGMDRWIDDNQAGLRYEVHPRVYFVQLETLTKQPEITIKKICEHVDIEYYPELMDYKNSTFKFDNQVPAKTSKREGKNHIENRVWQVNQPIFKDTSRWKDEANSEEMEMFENNKEFKQLMNYLKYL